MELLDVLKMEFGYHLTTVDPSVVDFLVPKNVLRHC